MKVEQAKQRAKSKIRHYFSQLEIMSYENINEMESIIDDIELMINLMLEQKINIYDDIKFRYERETRDMGE